MEAIFNNDFNRCKETFLKDCKGDQALFDDLRVYLKSYFVKMYIILLTIN